MNSAMRRTATYFHCCCAGLASAPAVVRAPNTTVPMPGNCRRQSMAFWFRIPCCGSVMIPFGSTPVVPRSAVSMPAGDFQTPRALSSWP